MTSQENNEKRESEKLKQLIEKNNNTIRILVIVLILLVIGGGVLGYLYYSKSLEAEKTQIEKQELINQFQNLSSDYEQLKTENDTINLKLVKRQVEIQKLINEINHIKRTNAQIISRYKSELNTLRDIMKSYIVQIDSLNRRNEILRAENLEVKTKYAATMQELEKEKEIKEDLSQKVEKASVLQAKNIYAIGVNSRGKEKDNINRIEKLRVCFTLMENPITSPGKKEIYTRIVRPDSVLLALSSENLFQYQDQMIIYSASRVVEYENRDLDVCIYYDNTGDLIEGTYTVNLYAEGHKIGATAMTLNQGIGFF